MKSAESLILLVKYERSGVIRNTGSISHTVVTEKNTHDFRLRVGSSARFSSRKQEEEKLHNYYVKHKFIVWYLKK